MRLLTSVKSPSGVFYTDLNGWQLVRRKTVSKLPIQGNFYPMPTMAVLQNETHRLSLLAAQPLGVASLEHGTAQQDHTPHSHLAHLPPSLLTRSRTLSTGWLEVMLDRRLNQDDQRGLGQGVKDNKVTAAHFRLLVEKRTQQAEVGAVSVSPGPGNVGMWCLSACRLPHSWRTLPSLPHPHWTDCCTLHTSPSLPSPLKSSPTSLAPCPCSAPPSLAIFTCSACAPCPLRAASPSQDCSSTAEPSTASLRRPQTTAPPQTERYRLLCLHSTSYLQFSAPE